MNLAQTPLACVLTSVLVCTVLPAQKPPAGFETVDHTIKIGMLPGRLRFDLERFSVAPGSKVKIELHNNDEMLHNLVVCKKGAGVLEKVIAGALGLGGEASAKHFVPDLPQVLWHTKALMPGESDTLWFRAPKERGDYPFVCTLPGHTFTMKGVMKVGSIEKPFLSGMRFEMFDGAFKKLSDLAMQKVVRRGEIEQGVLDVNRFGKSSNFGLWVHAKLLVKKSGKYRAFLRCDDGGRVRIDGTKVVEHDGVHGAGKWRKGEVELGAGEHELWIEYFQGGGGKILEVELEGPGVKRRPITKKSNPRPAGVPIAVVDEPVVMRVHVENASARGIAVGFPGGMNCVFDAVTCQVQFGWAGAFLDVGPDRLSRGGGLCRILGQRFEVGGGGGWLTGDGATRPVKFRGYRLGEVPRFEFDWGDRRASLGIRPAAEGVGLRYDVRIEGQKEPLVWRFGTGVVVASEQGEFKDGSLHVSADQASAFSVTVAPKGGAR